MVAAQLIAGFISASSTLVDPATDPGFWSQPIATILAASLAAFVALAALVFNIWTTRKNLKLSNRSVEASEKSAKSAEGSAKATETAASYAKTNAESAQRSSLSAHDVAHSTQKSLLEVQRSNFGVEKWRQREETFRTLRWASDKAVDKASGVALMGLGVLGALVSHTSLIQSEDEKFMGEVNRVVRDAAKSIVASVILNAATDGEVTDETGTAPPNNGDEDTKPDDSGADSFKRLVVTTEVRSAALVFVEIARLDGTLAEVSPFMKHIASGPNKEVTVKERDLLKAFGLESAFDVSSSRTPPVRQPEQDLERVARTSQRTGPDYQRRPPSTITPPGRFGPSIGGR